MEIVDYDRPRPGHYRVGVDFPESCGSADGAAFAVRVELGGRSRTVYGRAQRLVFDSRVMEFAVDADGDLLAEDSAGSE